MKKISLILLLSCMAFGSTFAQSAIKLNPLSLFAATVNVAYETKLSDMQTGQLGLFYSGVSVGDVSYSGIGITPEYRFYLGNGEALDGLYAGPFVRYQNLSLKADDGVNEGKASLTSFGGGLVLGRQWMFNDVFTLDIFLGPKYSSTSLDVESDSEEFDNLSGFFSSGLGVRFGVTVGLAL